MDWRHSSWKWPANSMCQCFLPREVIRVHVTGRPFLQDTVSTIIFKILLMICNLAWQFLLIISLLSWTWAQDVTKEKDKHFVIVSVHPSSTKGPKQVPVLFVEIIKIPLVIWLFAPIADTCCKKWFPNLCVIFVFERFFSVQMKEMFLPFVKERSCSEQDPM